MYVVEWADHAGSLQQRAFDSREAAQKEADRLSQQFEHVAILFETKV